MAKIAVELERALARRAAEGTEGGISSRLIARDQGWSVDDVLCTSGPRDRSFEEQHSCVRVVIVTAGSFQYRSPVGCDMMTPGSLLLGNAGQPFECGHEHGCGDRCISFGYTPDYFERLAADAGGRRLEFGLARVPAVAALSRIVARVCAGLSASDGILWEELSIKLAAQAIRLGGDACPSPAAPPGAVARVTRAIRMIERRIDEPLTIGTLAREARLSPYHFLRTFERVAGITPHQYILRARLRDAAARLLNSTGRIVDVALESGFGDVSNFNRTFRAEFGVSPRGWKKSTSDSY